MIHASIAPWRAWTAAAMLVLLLAPRMASAESIVTGSTTGTYIKIGENLRVLIAPTLEVKESVGSFANVDRLSNEPGVSLAIVQSDVYSGLIRLRDDATRPLQERQRYAELLRNLRVFMPLYKEEVHFLVRKDDPIEYVHQIRDKHIWMDSEKSGTYLTALTIYKALFDSIPKAVTPTISPRALGDNKGEQTRATAIMRLSLPAAFEQESDYEPIDVLVLVGGQPLKALTEKVPDNLKLLKFDPNHSTASRVLGLYQKALIFQKSYPNLSLPEAGIQTLAVDSYLITASFQDPARNRYVTKLATDICNNFPKLLQSGHPKWKDLAWRPGSKLPELTTGWTYAPPVRSALDSCAAVAPSPTTVCPDPMKILGLCS